MSYESSTKHQGEPSSPEQGVSRIIEPPSLPLPTIRSVEEPSNIRYDVIRNPMDEEIARAWISSAPPRHRNIPSQGDSHEGRMTGLDNFQDEYEGSVQSGKSNNSKSNTKGLRRSLKGLRKNLFSSSVVRTQLQSDRDSNEQITLGWRIENLFYRQDEEAGQLHIEDNQLDLGMVQNDADSPPFNNSMPSTPPSTEHDLMNLSEKSTSSDQDSKNRQYDIDNDKLSNQHASGSFEAVANPGEMEELPFDWMRSPQRTIPGEIVLDDDQQPNMENELLTRYDGENSINIDNKNGLFRPPTLGGAVSRPSPIRGEDRQVTPQSWHSPIARTMIHRNTSGGSSRLTGGVPLSPASRRSARSEKYFHSYQTNPETPPQPVPPFVVVHSSGSAVVTVTPKRTSAMKGENKRHKKNRKWKKTATDVGVQPVIGEEESIHSGKEANCACDGEDAKVWCRIWGRPVTVALASAAFALALVTVITSLVASRFQGTRPQQQPKPQLRPQTQEPTLAPTLAPTPTSVGVSINDVPDFGIDVNGTLFDLDSPIDGLVLRPYEGTQNPAQAPTLPPRTFSPTTLDDMLTFAPTMLPENFPDFVPTSMPIFYDDDDDDDDFSDDGTAFQIPWNNYVIGLLSVESPSTFASFADATSPQFLALQWISVAASRKGGSGAYTMDGSLQRFALATIYFSLGGADWFEDDSWLSTVVPLCEWKGVTCDSTNTAVLSLDLSSNNLSGGLPEELKLLMYLQILDLSHNDILGSLPPEYSTLYDLVELNLSENSLTGGIPEEYGGAGTFELLEVLDVSQNHIEGDIPGGICSSASHIAIDCTVTCECCSSCFGE